MANHLSINHAAPSPTPTSIIYHQQPPQRCSSLRANVISWWNLSTNLCASPTFRRLRRNPAYDSCQMNLEQSTSALEFVAGSPHTTLNYSLRRQPATSITFQSFGQSQAQPETIQTDRWKHLLTNSLDQVQADRKGAASRIQRPGALPKRPTRVKRSSFPHPALKRRPAFSGTARVAVVSPVPRVSGAAASTCLRGWSSRVAQQGSRWPAI